MSTLEDTEIVQIGNRRLPVLHTHVEKLEPPADPSRRDMMQLLGATMAFAAGVPGCDRKPKRKIISRVHAPEYQKPGKALYYSSTWTEGPYPYGLVVKTVDGRPVKVDGNPDHPATSGASTATMQAMVLGLYDPDRLKTPSLGNRKVSWSQADAAVVEALCNSKSTVLVTHAQLGPSERALLQEFLALAPHATHMVHEAIHDGPRRQAHAKLYGSDGELVPRFDRARVILSLDSDFLGTDGAVVSNIRRFAEGRRLDGEAAFSTPPPSRLYVAESTMSVTGSNADHRIRVKPSAVAALVAALGTGEEAVRAFAKLHGLGANVLGALRSDLFLHRGRSLVVAGPHLPAAVHAEVAALNAKLGAHQQVLEWDPMPPSLPVTPTATTAEATAKADVVVLLGVNPEADGLRLKGRWIVAHALHNTESVRAAHLKLPSAHNLESWNDRVWGQAGESLCQPAIAPLYESRQEAESLLRWTQGLAADAHPINGHQDWHAYVKHRWTARPPTDPLSETVLGGRRQRAWNDALRTGGAFAATTTALPELNVEAAAALTATNIPANGVEVVIHPHHAVFDGRFANNPWLHELPDPVSKLVWDSVASLSVATAKRLGVSEGDLLKIRVGKTSVTMPALVQPGAADDVIGLTLGYGQDRGEVAREAAGANAATLLNQGTLGSSRWAAGVEVTRTRGKRRPVRTQTTFDMHDRPVVIDGTYEEFQRDPTFVRAKKHQAGHKPLYPSYDYSKGSKWGMAIDLNTCIGCNACVTGCQAENNIAVVGRDDCAMGRDMHWIRIDRYEKADTNPDEVTVHNQPMLCQHCDDAPCENVCPVKATTHSPEGLNEMAYNRCVGTRYCSNNCPYKVRRFNYRRYQEKQNRAPVLELVHNPQVTVRSVGVMEKCTFCVQRIQEAKIAAKNSGTPMADGDVTTACQQACPAKAIHFGDVNVAGSQVAEDRKDPRAFHVLEELNVNPNVTYLAQIRNPNPTVPSAAPGKRGRG